MKSLVFLVLLSGCWVTEVEVKHVDRWVPCVSDYPKPPSDATLMDLGVNDLPELVHVLWAYMVKEENWKNKMWHKCKLPVKERLAPI